MEGREGDVVEGHQHKEHELIKNNFHADSFNRNITRIHVKAIEQLRS